MCILLNTPFSKTLSLRSSLLGIIYVDLEVWFTLIM
jgi:hypothetical protein